MSKQDFQKFKILLENDLLKANARDGKKFNVGEFKKE
jgi:hypothetical protein